MPSRNMLRLITMVLVCLSSSPALAAAPDVVRQIPGDAPVFIAAPKLSKLLAKIAVINQKLGFNQMRMNNTLGFAKAMLGLMAGVDDAGGAAVVLTDIPISKMGTPGTPGGAAEPKVLVILPVSNYQTFLGNFGVNSGNGVQSVTMMNKQMHVKQVGRYAVISDDQAQVVAYRAPAANGSVAAVAGDYVDHALAHSDIVFGVNLATMVPIARSALKQQLAQMGQMLKMFGGGDPQTAQFMGVFLTLYGNVLDALLRDGELLLCGLDVSRHGLGISCLAQFREGSPLANTFARNPSQPPRFSRLPNRPYLFAMSMNSGTLPLRQWAHDLVNVLPKDNGFSRVMASADALTSAAGDEWQFAFYAPASSAAASRPLANGLYVVSAPNPQQYVAAYRQLVTSMNSFGFGGFSYQTTYQSTARQIGDQLIDQYTIGMVVPAAMQQQAGPATLATARQKGLVIPIDGAVVVALDAEDAIISEVLAMDSTANSLDQGKSLAATRKRLPRKSIAQFYVNIGGIIDSARRAAPRSAMAAVPSLPASLPPIGASISASGGTIAMRIHVPTAVISAIKNAATGAASSAMVRPARR